MRRLLDSVVRSAHAARSAAVGRWAAVVLLVVALSVGGFLFTLHAIDADRRATARSQAESTTDLTRTMLERAGAFAAGIGNALAGEPAPDVHRFNGIVGSATPTVGLADAMWVERVPAAARRRYERRLGAPITLPPGTRRAPPAAAYLPATFVAGLPFRPGVDTKQLPALAAALANPTSIFAGTATAWEEVAGQPGFFVLQEAQFGRGPGSRGLLVVFIPAGWLAVSPTSAQGRTAISLEGHRLAGTVGATPAASESFDALTRRWRVEVGKRPETAFETIVPLVALVWPAATALIAYLTGRGMQRRRRAEREVDDIFDLSLDPLCVMGVDGSLRRVNPAFAHTLGYPAEQLITHRVREFAHPDDREGVARSIDRLRTGDAAQPFEARFLCADGSVRWLTWNMRPVPARGVMYGAAYDVTSARGLLEEQAALRRVATLVAKGAGADELFGAVTTEVGVLLGADATRLLRYEGDGSASVVAAHGAADAEMGLRSGERSDEGERWRRVAERAVAVTHGGGDRTESPANELHAPAVERAFAAPIVVSGQRWGMIVAAWTSARAADPASEARMEQFTELVATAVANAEDRSALAQSRRRVVAAADEARRRIERDLHDGAQQRLVEGVIALKLARRRLADGSTAAELVEQALATTETANEELRELARGIHPAVLSRGGLQPALKGLAERSPIPVSLTVRTGGRLPESLEVTIYFVVSEALVNAAKHSGAAAVSVAVQTVDDRVLVSISDDGAGGANSAHGSGLVGMKDRVEAVGGTLTVQSAPGAGTQLAAELPLEPVATAGAASPSGEVV